MPCSLLHRYTLKYGCRTDAEHYLRAYFKDSKNKFLLVFESTEACSIECSAMAAVSLGLVFVSSCNEEARSLTSQDYSTFMLFSILLSHFVASLQICVDSVNFCGSLK